jgi:hypothetical protein
MVRIPLRNRDGVVIAEALVDDQDAGLAERRWYRHNKGYVTRKEWLGDNKWQQHMLHREVFGLADDDPREVDHINRDKLDNRRSNLRVGTHALNCQNVAGHAGSSMFRGVCWHRRAQKWHAYGYLKGQRHHLGTFEREEDAATAVSAWRAEHMPFSQDARAA